MNTSFRFIRMAFAVALVGLALVGTAQAGTTTINFGGDRITKRDGTTLIPVGALYILVEDFSHNGFGNLNPAPGPWPQPSHFNTGDPLTLGATTATSNGDTDNKVVFIGTVGTAGQIADTAILTIGSPAVAGDPLALFWFPDYTAGSTTYLADSSSYYGFYNPTALALGATPNGFGDPWVVGPDGGSVTLDPVLTVLGGGSLAESYGAALYPIPEPSTYIAVAGGLVMLVASLRRRR